MNTEHDELSQAEDPEDMGGEESPESEEGPLTESPPAESHGWLEQFSHFSNELKNIVGGWNYNGRERMVLAKVGITLFVFACHNLEESDFSPEEKQEMESLMLELESKLHLSTK